jgi:hypothetical protein
MEKKELPYLKIETIQQSLYIIKSYQQLIGKQMIEKDATLSPADISYLLYHAPFVVLSHSNDVDPIFNYANLMAQQLFEMDWKTIIGMPSRLSAQKISQEERAILVKTAQEKGYIDNYFGVRISAKGKLFQIENTLLWNLVDENNQFIGQAAIFRDWSYM